MQKELIIATTSQETKIAVLEDDELVEYYIERHQSQGIVGNIYKGRVTKVLPGMQSAFVDIGLERDAFLYVSDFFEDTEEYDKIVSTVEEEVAQLQEGVRPGPPALPQPLPLPVPLPVPVQASPIPVIPPPIVPDKKSEPEPVQLSPEPVEEASVEGAAPRVDDGRRQRSGRDRGDRGDRPDRGGGRDGRNKKPRIPSFENRAVDNKPPVEAAPPREDRPFTGLAVLPGETLKKYSGGRPEPPVPPRESQPMSDQLEEGGVDASAIEGTVPDLSKRMNRDEITPTPTEETAHKVPPFEGGWPKAGGVPEAQPMSDQLEEGGIDASAIEGTVPDLSKRMNRDEVTPTPTEETAHSHSETAETESTDDPSSASARITDRSDKLNFANRPSNRRQRRRGPPPSQDGKSEEHHRPNGPAPKASPMISELLREGQEILVQIAKEPLGKKGARITSHIALPGRYLVYMPTVDHIGVSRKISSEEERSRLKRIIQEHRGGLPGGFIVRTAAEGHSEEEFIQDLRFLGNLWTDIRSRSDKKSAPALIHRDLNLVQRMLRDQLSPDFRAIRLDNEHEFAKVLDFVNKFQSALVNRVKLHLKDTPIFEEYGLNVEIDKALRPKVWLKSGGHIVINQTEALVAIDVNTGKFVGKSNRLEDTIVKTNVDAVQEIVRQIRLRNLGGIIVVDFIDMEEKKNRQRVMTALEEALRADRAPSKILQFNDFGLVAITRKRTQPSLERTLCHPCSHCNGAGWTKSPETICYDIQQEMKKMAPMLDGKEITVRVNPEVAKVLKSGEFVSTHELEEWTKKDIIVKSDPLLHEEHFDIF